MELERLLNEFEMLSKATDFMTVEQARRVIELINNIVRERVSPHIIDILWRREALDGVILEPIDAAPCFNQNSGRGPLRPFEIKRTPGESVQGVWAWLYEHHKPVWIEDVRSLNLKAPVPNRASEDEIGAEYLYIHETTDSIMAVPLVTRDALWGVYSVELPESRRFNLEFLQLLKHLASYVARVLWKVEALRHNQRHTDDAIGIFSDSIRSLAQWEELSPHRTGFIARPFAPSFEPVETWIAAQLRKKGVDARHYQHPPGRAYVLDEILGDIRKAHFGIADVTGCNPNVMLELGIMISLGKPRILLQVSDDPLEEPFNVRPFHLYRYEVRAGPELLVATPGSARMQPMEQVLESWLIDLDRDPAFRHAKPWS